MKKIVFLFIAFMATFAYCSKKDNDSLNTVIYSKADMQQAEKLLKSLPPACKKDSQITVQNDGAIGINIVCEGTNAMDGYIEIKDGKVKKIN